MSKKETPEDRILRTIGGITLGVLFVVGVTIGGSLLTAAWGWLMFSYFALGERLGLPLWAILLSPIPIGLVYGLIYRWTGGK